MFSYTAKPRQVEAWQYFRDVGTDTACIPRWAIQLALDKVIRPNANRDADVFEGEPLGILLESGDWIVKDGDKYSHFTNERFHVWYTPTV